MAKSLLDDVMIAAPCDVPWESMRGDERVRTCAGCSKNVYNISDMSQREAEEFIKTHANPCLRLFRRADGTLINDNCPRALRKMRDRFRKLAAAAAGLVAALLCVDSVQAQDRYIWAQGGPRPAIATSPHLSPRSGMVAPSYHDPQQGDPTGGPQVQIWNAPNGPIQSPSLPRSSQGVQLYEAGPDTSALQLYTQAVRCEKAGSTLLAKTLYSEALEAAQKNRNTDPAFEQLLRDSVNRLQQELRGY